MRYVAFYELKKGAYEKVGEVRLVDGALAVFQGRVETGPGKYSGDLQGQGLLAVGR